MNTNYLCHSCVVVCAVCNPCENVMLARQRIRCQHGGLQLVGGMRGCCAWLKHVLNES